MCWFGCGVVLSDVFVWFGLSCLFVCLFVCLCGSVVRSAVSVFACLFNGMLLRWFVVVLFCCLVG